LSLDLVYQGTDWTLVTLINTYQLAMNGVRKGQPC